MAKSASKQNQINTSNFIPSILILAFLLVGFIPNLEAVDKIAPQWLYLSVLNLICGFFLFFKRKIFADRISKILSSKMAICYIAFVSVGCLFIFLCYKLNGGIGQYYTSFQYPIYVLTYRNFAL